MKHSEVEPEPSAAGVLCGDALPTVRAFASHIAQFGEELGLVGPRELDRLWTRHILNSAVIAPIVPTGTLVDIGSGAGFPGLVVAILRPDVSCVLVEPLGRRAAWLQDEAQRLGLTNVTVMNARAEDVVGHVNADCATARAVTALKNLIPMAAKLVKPGGEFAFLKGQRVEEEIRDAAKVMVRWNLANPRVDLTGPEYGTEETRVFRATVG